MRQFDYEQIKNPEFFRENRLDAHSDHIWYRSFAEEGEGSSSFRKSLNGIWKFAYTPNYQTAPKGFETDEYDCRGWADIRVPAHIQLEGYGNPQYVNIQYPWDGRQQVKPGQIPEQYNPVGSYVKYFTVPASMQGQPLYISFQGAESALALWCNGNYVGYAEDSFTPSEFELTPFLREGENKLAVQVFQWCAGSLCEDQDFFRFFGIFREVFLYTVPKTHLWDIRIQTLLDESFDSAELVLDWKREGAGNIRAVLTPPSVQALSEQQEQSFAVQALSEQQEQSFTAQASLDAGRMVLKIETPLLWSAEEPNLYRLELTVTDEKGQIQEVIPQQVGFRRFELKDNLMKLNGKRIVFKGVNRHEFSSRTGRVVSDEELWQDLITIKQNNINAIRTCHYPNDSRIYRLCDRLGLYMIDECNLESHGSWDPVGRGMAERESVVPGNHPEWNAIMLDRANSMYQRDKNHPAILIWSCGNESFGGKNIYDMSNFFREKDKGRLVHYEGIFNDRSYPATSDMESQMYTHAEDIEEWLRRDRSKPFICCEYAHAMGNSCGAMHKYTELADREPLYQGGFIWDYIDQSICKNDRYGKEFQAYGGDFDDRPSDYNFSGNGIVYGGDRKPSPKMQEVKYNYQNIGIEIEQDKIKVHNKNLFVSTAALDCFVRLEKLGKLLCEIKLSTDVKPGESGEFALPAPVLQEKEGENGLPAESLKNCGQREGNASETTITVSFRLHRDTMWAKAGHEVAFEQRVFGETDWLLYAKSEVPGKMPEVICGNYNLGVRGEGFEALFSYASGGLVSYRFGGRELLKSIPKPNFWRAPVDNDCGNDMAQRYGQWKLASLYATHKGAEYPNPIVEMEETCVSVTYVYLLPTTPAAECRVTYRVYGDGTIQTTLCYRPTEGLGDMPEFGMLFKLDADYDILEWYGNGPEETYADRQKGAKLSVYRNRVADNMAHYLVPQECGNKTEVRYAKVTDKKGRGLLFMGNHMYFSALPYTPHELENATHPNELPSVHYTVVRVALGQMGIGGDDSWGSKVHDEYLLPTDKPLEFTFCFRGI